MKLAINLAIAAALVTLVPSCYQMQPFAKESIAGARVELSQNNYRVLATRVSGEDTGFTLLPLAGTAANIVTFGVFDGIIPNGIEFKSPSDVEAIKQLYKNAGANKPGRATQIINVRKEIGGLNAFIFGRPKVRYTADLIEFTH